MLIFRWKRFGAAWRSRSFDAISLAPLHVTAQRTAHRIPAWSNKHSFIKQTQSIANKTSDKADRDVLFQSIDSLVGSKRM